MVKQHYIKGGTLSKAVGDTISLWEKQLGHAALDQISYK